jgi:hypothetical protein
MGELIIVFLPVHLALLHAWNMKSIVEHTMVFDGGNPQNPPLLPPSTRYKLKHPWLCLRISRGDLYIPDTVNPLRGLIYKMPTGQIPPFLRIPRYVALDITGMSSISNSSQFCSCLQSAYLAQKASVVRSAKKIMFSDAKNCILGTQPNRAQPGVRSKTYNYESMPRSHWNHIIDVMKGYEKAYAGYVQTSELVRINTGQKAVKFTRLSGGESSDQLESSDEPATCLHFGALSFGKDVHLSAHTDADFGLSVATVHLQNRQYTLDDDIIVYFCFPRLGCAVPMRPGDCLIFNAREPHAVSSRSKSTDQIFCVSMYLKTAVVGLNDNSIQLRPMEDLIFNYQL